MEFNLNYNESFVTSNPFSQTSNLEDLQKNYINIIPKKQEK